MIFCINGKFVPEAKATISVLDHGFLYGDGCYDTLRTYGGNIVELDLHLDRIEKDAQALGIRLPWTRAQLGTWILKMSRRNAFDAARIRVTITRGMNGGDFTKSKHPLLVITGEPLVINPKIYKKGYDVSTIKLERPLAHLKTLGLASTIVARQKAATNHNDEIIYVGEKNMVREGTATNVFIVKNGTISTPAHGVLPGLTRGRIVTLARKAGYKINVCDFTVRSLLQADEVFLSNTPLEIIPVTRCNGRIIGNGKPGPVTQELLAAYRAYAKRATGLQ